VEHELRSKAETNKKNKFFIFWVLNFILYIKFFNCFPLRLTFFVFQKEF
jgi:hypothetical protein